MTTRKEKEILRNLTMKPVVAVALAEDVNGRWVVVEAVVPVILAADWRARKLTTTTAKSFDPHCHLPIGELEGAWVVGKGMARLD
jgi:hypothetical protein